MEHTNRMQINMEKSPEHKLVNASVGNKGVSHSLAIKNTGKAIDGSNSHMPKKNIGVKDCKSC